VIAEIVGVQAGREVEERAHRIDAPERLAVIELIVKHARANVSRSRDEAVHPPPARERRKDATPVEAARHVGARADVDESAGPEVHLLAPDSDGPAGVTGPDRTRGR